MIETEQQRKHVVWVNIPISRSVNSMVTNASNESNGSSANSPKRVRWSEDLTQIRDISPSFSSSLFWPVAVMVVMSVVIVAVCVSLLMVVLVGLIFKSEVKLIKY